MKLTGRFYENKSATHRFVGTIHSVNFGLFAKIRFHWASLRSCLAPGLDQKLISPGVSWNTYIYRNGDKQAGGFRRRVEIEGVRNMKYEGRDDGWGKFVRFLSFCSGRWKGRTSTGSFVNCPANPGGLTREKRIMPVIRKKNKTTADKMWHIIKWVYVAYRKKCPL